MLPSVSSSPFHNSPDPRNSLDRNLRPIRPPTHTQSNMGFNPESTSSSTGIYGNWSSGGGIGGGIGASMNDPFAPSRSHYQPGFLMSGAQKNVVSPGGQLFDNPPLIPTKFNYSNSRTSPSQFGLESMFDNPRRKRPPPPRDEDAPPLASVRDIPYNPRGTNPIQRRVSPPGSPQATGRRRRPFSYSPKQPPQPQLVTYLTVFGYPPDHYETIAKLFKNLGDTTEPEPSENRMWFTIGFHQAWEAERALRRNGKLMEDLYLIGVARVLPPLVDLPGISSGSPPKVEPFTPGKEKPVPVFDPSPTNPVGVPLTLAPSTSAFRTPSPKKPAKPTEPGFGAPYAQPTPAGIVMKFADIIFGW